MPSIRLLSVNAGALPGGRDALVRLIAEQQTEVVCVHGLPNLIRWRQAVGAIARRAGKVVVCGGGRQAGSVLVLSDLGVDGGPSTELRFTGTRGLHPAGASIARLGRHGVEVVFAGATLIGNAAERVGQVGELHDAIADLAAPDVPRLISAEGTDRPGTAAWQALLGNGVAVAGRVFVDGRLGVEGSRELGGNPFTAPVVVEVALG